MSVFQADGRTHVGKAIRPARIAWAADLRRQGWRVVDIASEIGVAPATVSVYLWESGTIRLPTTSQIVLAEATRKGWREYRAERLARGDVRVRRGDRRRLRKAFASDPSNTLSLDYRLDAYNNKGGELIERVADRGLDPFVILTGTTADHMNEVLGDLTVEDVGRMDEHQLHVLQQRIIAAGMVPPTVQRSEKERLRPITPHRGNRGPAPTRQRMGRHRKLKRREVA